MSGVKSWVKAVLRGVVVLRTHSWVVLESCLEEEDLKVAEASPGHTVRVRSCWLVTQIQPDREVDGKLEVEIIPKELEVRWTQ